MMCSDELKKKTDWSTSLKVNGYTWAAFSKARSLADSSEFHKLHVQLSLRATKMVANVNKIYEFLFVTKI